MKTEGETAVKAITLPLPRSIWADMSYRVRLTRLDMRNTWRRWRNAYRYARGRLDSDQAAQVIYDCRAVAGSYPLVTFSVEDVLDHAQDEYGEHPALPALAAWAADRVWQKWSGDDGETAGAAIDWAVRLVGDYAAEEGIELQRQPGYEIDDEPDLDEVAGRR